MASNNVLKNTTIYAIGDIIPKIVNFIFFPILTNYLTPDDYGIINYVNSLNAFVLILSVLCLNTYYMVYYNKVQDEMERKRMLGSLSIFIVALNVIVTAILLLIGRPFFDRISDNIPFYPYIVIGLFINLFNSLGVLPIATLRMEEDVKTFTILSVAKAACVTVGTFFAVVYIAANAISALMVQMVVILLFSILFLIVTSKHTKYVFDTKYVKDGLAFSLPLVPGSLAYYAVTMSDRIFINKYLTLFDLGIYSTASTLALILVTISSCAYKAFEPYVFKLPNNDSKDQAIVKLFKNYYFAVVFSALGISLLSKEFLLFFADPKYLVAYKYVPLLLIGTIFTSLSLLFSTVVISNGLTKINSMISIIGGMVSVGLNIVLLRYGVVYACLTSMISLGVMFVLNVYYSRIKIAWSKYFVIFLFVFCFQYIFFLYQMNNVIEIILKMIYLIVVALAFYHFSDIKLKNIIR